ncbi:MAG: carboxypeptidase regulatory-like domain-containing protein [Sedimentisphaerales bacterium]|nr:carboxypeptidase regulatory-like domain-containing protein [Sedimentisphaerales bacterium]
MKAAVRGTIKPYLISLCLIISVANSVAWDIAEKQAPPQKFLEITILDKISNEPISGVRVNARVIQEAGGDIREEKLTDENGQCTFQIEDKTIAMLRLEAVRNGYVPITLSLSASEAIEKIAVQHTLYLDKGTNIGGIVQDSHGNPINGVIVSVSLQSSDRNDMTAVSGYEVKTDANGLWVCDIIPEKPDRITIRFTHPDYRTENFRGQAPSPMVQMLQEMSHIIIMQKQLNLTGQVLDRDGVPIEGALVAQGGDRRSIYYPSTKTDSEGRYTFENVTPGEMFLTVQAAGYSPDTIRFLVDRQMSPIVFRLEPGHTITGQVIDPNNKPIPDVTLSADTWREFRSLTWETTTDANGRFVWNDAPADEVMININKRRYIIIRNYSIKPSEKDYVITLMPELVIHGKIVDANSGEPVSDFRFYPGVEGGAGQDISWKSGLKITKRNDYEMRFTYPSNEYYIRVEADGYEPEVSRAISGNEGNVVLDFKLKKIVPAEGIILLPDGKPLADAEVMVVTRQLRILNGKAGARPSNDKLSVKTDAAGKFSFFPKAEQYSIVILHEQGYAFIKSDELAALQNITLSAWAKLEGTLKIGDKPGGKETIAYNPQSLPELAGVVFDFQTQTDDKGVFVFDRVFSGEGSVTRLLRKGSALQLNTHTVGVNAAPGQKVNVQIGGTGRPVTGKIIIPEQIKDRTGWQYIEGGLNINSKNNPYILISFNINNDGSFHIDDVPAGEYLLSVQAYDRNSQIQMSSREQIALLTHQISVPEMPSGRSGETLELGEFELAITTEAVAGQSLIGKPMPDFENITTDYSTTQGKSILICFWDFEQRPSRNGILELNKKAGELKEKNIEIAAIHISKIDKKTLDDWLRENNITISIGTAGDNESKVRYNWGIKSLPWMVLTNSEHIVIKEGFGVNELD